MVSELESRTRNIVVFVSFLIKRP